MLNLLPRKCFEINLADGTVIKGQFGTWALKRLCDKNNWTLKEVGEKLSNPFLSDAINYILAAVEFTARQSGLPFSYTDVHASDWVDQLGGLNEGSGFITLFNHSADEVKEEPREEKKTELS